MKTCYSQETLALVRKYDSIMDANAYLMEMTGDVLSAMDLIVSHLSGLLRDLRVNHCACVCLHF